MIPWEILERAQTPDGQPLVLRRRGDEFVISVGNAPLMGSRRHGSEEVLAEQGLTPYRTKPGARVLVGGLGLGFTLKAALAAMPEDAHIEVAEVIPAVVEWNRTHLGHLAGHPLNDPRTRVFTGDVADIMVRGAPWDAILLDTDNGPDGLTQGGNDRLYSNRGLERAFQTLAPGGVLAIWSAHEDRAFDERLSRHGFRVRKERVLARRTKGERHTLWFATRPTRV